MNRQLTCRMILLVALSLAGCGGGPLPETDAEPQTLYTTADELLAHINVLLGRNPIDDEALDALYYPENDLQRRLSRAVRSSRPFHEMQHKVFERYGAGLNAAFNFSPLAPLPPATIVDRSPQRALATTTLADGEPYNIYLVQIGEGWWISGYTVERIFETPQMAEGFAEIMDGSDRLATASRSFMGRIDRGEFATIEEVRVAWHAHLRPN